MIRWHESASLDDAYADLAGADGRAYELLEECRIRCERLTDAADGSVMIEAIHREIGLAGYFASDAMSPAIRGRILAIARTRAGIDLGGPEHAVANLQRTVECSLNAIDMAMQLPGAGDHMHLAQMYVLSARDALSRVRLSSCASTWP
jgi:hypothetical protein